MESRMSSRVHKTVLKSGKPTMPEGPILCRRLGLVGLRRFGSSICPLINVAPVNLSIEWYSFRQPRESINSVFMLPGGQTMIAQTGTDAERRWAATALYIARA